MSALRPRVHHLPEACCGPVHVSTGSFTPRLGLFQKLAQWPRNKPPLEFLQSVDGQVGTTGHTARDIASPDSHRPLSRRLSGGGRTKPDARHRLS